MSSNTKTLHETLQETAEQFSNQPAINFAGRILDFRSVNRLSDAVATSLAQYGIGKGDRVSLYCPNSDAFVLAYFGILKAAATVVPINTLLNPKEIAFILNDSGSQGLIYHDAFATNVRKFNSLAHNLRFQVCIGTHKAFERDLSWSDFLARAPQPANVKIKSAEDIAVILYTSGTTGFPKGAMLTHRNLLSNVESIWEAVRLKTGKEIFLVVLPMFHAFAATASMLTALLHGCVIVPLPRFEPEATANAIERVKATVFMAVPSMFLLFLKLPSQCTTKFRSIKFCISGGASMPVEVMKQFEARFGLPIYEGDGPTECAPVTCINPIGGRRKPGTVGLPLPGVEMKIMDEQARELKQGEIGEICVRGPNVMKGYWQQPEETRKAFFGEWFRTGDLGMVDTDGYFSIVDRKKDMIIVNGINVYPRIVEEVLYTLPAVREAAVVGEAHKLHGEIVTAYISLKEGAELTEKDVRAFCRKNLARHEVPRKVFFLPKLPKNAAGKIFKRALQGKTG